jgi:nucleoid-associated protein YgaU
MADTGPAKAVLAEQADTSKQLVFHFNPTTVSFTRAVAFNRTPKQGSNDPPVQFTGAGPTSMSLQILLDAVGTGRTAGVQPEIDLLVSWTTVPDVTKPGEGPPRLVFTWGVLTINKEKTLVGYLEQLKVTCELFDRQGCPLRATVDLTLKSAAQEPKGTNPSSGSERSRRQHVLRREETLHSLAFDTFGDPGAWRAIADLNGVDDPTRVRPGRELLLPDVSELAGARR